LNQTSKRLPWGVVVADARFPLIWDANHAEVLEDDPTLTLEDVRAALHPAVRTARSPYEHVEFWDASLASPAFHEMTRQSVPRHPDVVMVFEGKGPGGAASNVDVQEVEPPRPDSIFWSWYRLTRNEFNQRLSEEVIEQLMDRDRRVFVPAGLRWLVGFVDGRMAGFATLISLNGVGYISDVVTMRSFRRRGVATSTVLRAVGASKEQGDEMVHLLAEEGGGPQLLYERLGFRTMARVQSFTRQVEWDRARPD
jgi:ribosomal protein S18 acetylase RimI-like enzyme